MPNSLTGDFDAIVQVSERTVNRLLASLHQNEAGESDARSLPHQVVIRIDDPALGGAAAGVRGVAYLQIGAPTVSLIAGTPQATDVSFWIRGRYRADAGTTPVPESVNAKVTMRAGVSLEATSTGAGIRASISDDESAVVLSEHSLSAADAARVAAIVRWCILTRTDAVLPLGDVLPPGVGAPLAIVDAQGRRAVALPISFSGAAPTGGTGDVVLESSDFVIAVSAEFVLSLIQPALEAVKNLHPTFSVSAQLDTATYTVSIHKADASWLPDGRVHIAVAGKATTPAFWAPNVSFSVSQDLKIVVHFPAFSDGFVVSVVPAGSVSASASASGPFAGIAESAAKTQATKQFVQARENALAQLAPLINEMAGKTQLLRKVLATMDAKATLDYQEVAPGPDGIAIRGKVNVSPRKAPRIEFAELGDGSGYNAFNTWVPGGRVISYAWTWWRTDYPMNVVFGGPEVRSKTLKDSFLLQAQDLPVLPHVPPPPTSTGAMSLGGSPPEVLVDPGPPVWGQVCLRIVGEHTHPVSGTPWAIAETFMLNSNLACSFAGPPIPIHIVDIPIKVWLFDPDPPDFSPVLHVDLWSPWQQQPSMATLLLQAGGDPVPSLALLRDVLRSLTGQPIRLLVVVSGQSSEAPPNRELVDSVARIGREVRGVTILFSTRNITEGRVPIDGKPVALLLGADGRVVWRHDNRPDARSLAGALREHASAIPASGLRLLGLAVRPGERAPDFAIETASGERTRLRRLRGRRVTIVFAPPEPAAFDRLLAGVASRLTNPDADLSIVIVDDRRDLDAAGRVFGPRSLLVSDRERAISRSYGVRARPTVVQVDYDGRISSAQVISGVTAAVS